MFCPKCGCEQANDNMFCENCGCVISEETTHPEEGESTGKCDEYRNS